MISLNIKSAFLLHLCITALLTAGSANADDASPGVNGYLKNMLENKKNNPWYNNYLKTKVIPAAKKDPKWKEGYEIGFVVDEGSILISGGFFAPTLTLPGYENGFGPQDAEVAVSGTFVNCDHEEGAESKIGVDKKEISETIFKTTKSIGSTAGVKVGASVEPFGIGISGDSTFEINVDESWTKSTSHSSEVGWAGDTTIRTGPRTQRTFKANVYNLDLDRIPAKVSWAFTKGELSFTAKYWFSDPKSAHPETIIGYGNLPKVSNLDITKNFSKDLRTTVLEGTYTHTGAAAAIIVIYDSEPVSSGYCGDNDGGHKIHYDKKPK